MAKIQGVSFFTDYAKQTQNDDDEFVIPEDLGSLSVEDLNELSDKAISTFDGIYADGKGLSDDDIAALSALTKGIQALNSEIAKHAEAEAKRSEQAAALAAQVRPQGEMSAETQEGEAPVEDEEEDEEEAPAEDEGAGETVTAAGARIPLSAVRARSGRVSKTPAPGSSQMARVVRLTDTEEGSDWAGMSAALNRRLQSFNLQQYQAAARSGRRLHEQKNLATFTREFPEDLIIKNGDRDHISAVLAHAVDESRLKGGSLTASGGWGAPSEIMYDMCELESRDGLFSMPEVSVRRGGLQFTTGPNFSSLYNDITGFHYTEAQDIAGTYAVDANGMGTGGAGDKPVYRVEMPVFEEKRLEPDGLIIEAGLLQQRGYPEAIARTLRGAMVVRDHRTAGRLISQIETGSTAVTMTAGQVGATAPLLDAIEMQAQHYLYVNRMQQSTTLETVFPYWVHGVIRADLSRRLGVDLVDVSDARIDAMFRARKIAPQFVYNWQDLTGAAGTMVSWPTSLKFLMYSAGTWVKGADDVISLDTMYDSTLLGQNDYTALFVEDAWFVAKMCHDSRAITIALDPDGATHAGVLIEADGTATPVGP